MNDALNKKSPAVKPGFGPLPTLMKACCGLCGGPPVRTGSFNQLLHSE